jgi:hypothetical protein
MDEQTLSGLPDLAPRDIGHLIDALLQGIDRGELEATPEEVRFLRSVADLLEPAS